MAEERGGSNIKEIRWQKAHLDPEEAGISEEEKQHREGNGEADEAAKAAAEEERTRLKGEVDLEDFKAAMLVWKLMKRVLHQWPAQRRNLERRKAKQQAKIGFKHEWVASENQRFLCKSCGASTAKLTEKKKDEVCKAAEAEQAVRAAEQRGHRLRWRSWCGAAFVFCKRCGGRTCKITPRKNKVLAQSLGTQPRKAQRSA